MNDPSTALLTDLYQLTMACGYWRTGLADREAVFHLHFRRTPFQGAYAVACGLRAACAWLDALRFSDDDVGFLRGLRGNDGEALFPEAFLTHLRGLELALDVDAIPEGTVVFAHEPLLRVKGPLLQCQLVETALLNLVNFQTLIATKASRVCAAAQGESVLEFGLRRAQGIDGSLAASYAAHVGGCDATSNVLAGKLFGIPVRGTHAHAWVMAFGDEREAFAQYAAALPNNCVFLVDTYDTLDGVRNACDAGDWLRAHGHRLAGVRLDSGDLAALSVEARKILDARGFADAAIVASNDLDERLIQSLKLQGAAITVWGVGTKLVTAYDQPALGGVYKLSAIRDEAGVWQHRVKVSEQAAKTSIPGIHQVRRYERDGVFVGDVIYDTMHGAEPSRTAVDLADATRRRTFEATLAHHDLLVPVYRGGVRTMEIAPVSEVRARTASQLASLPAGTRRFDNPQPHFVGLEASLHDTRVRLVDEARAGHDH